MERQRVSLRFSAVVANLLVHRKQLTRHVHHYRDRVEATNACHAQLGPIRRTLHAFEEPTLSKFFANRAG